MSKISEQAFLFTPEQQPSILPTELSLQPWKILIVDDDKDIHTVTTLAIADLQVFNRKLVFHHAYSAKQAIQLLKQHSDIALILLDVVMETNDAGLIAVQRIREELNLDEVRIILCTGQLGNAPEQKVIQQYDINDYKTKTELTRAKLTISVTAAIRSYQQIRIINQNRRGLTKIITATATLMEQHSLQSFSEGVLIQLFSLIGLPAAGIICAQIEDDGSPSKSIYVLGAAGEYTPFIKFQLERLEDEEVIRLIRQCLHRQQHVFSVKSTVLFLGNNQHNAAVFIKTSQPIVESDQQLIELFLSNISIGYENAALFQKLKYAAYIDPLTKIPNRNEFIQFLQQTYDVNAEHNRVVLVDIEHFSDINDGLGQDIGNEVLIAVASRLSQHFGLQVQLARIGGDVFGLIGASIILSTNNINAAFAQPFLVADYRLQLTIKIGLCNLQDAGAKALSILKSVTIALNLAKKSLTTNYQYYQPAMAEQMSHRLTILRNLAYDFSQRKLELWYQPQLSLQTKKIVGLEALLRWPQSNGGFISPAIFIPLAEYSGLIVEIGDWVLQQACMQIKQFTQADFDMRIAVNVSIQQFRSEHFVPSVIEAISQHDINPRHLEIEITESILMDEPHVIIAALHQLKALGVTIAIDDFGMGFSSLSYIQKLPLDRIKIDRAFIANVATSSDEVIVETIIRLGKKLQLTTIAEGVENAAQQQALTELGCDEIQGFYYAKPMPVQELLQLLQQQK